MPYRYVPLIGTIEYFYAPSIQPKFSDPNGSSITIWSTYQVGQAMNDDFGAHQVITAIKVVSLLPHSTSSALDLRLMWLQDFY